MRNNGAIFARFDTVSKDGTVRYCSGYKLVNVSIVYGALLYNYA